MSDQKHNTTVIIEKLCSFSSEKWENYIRNCLLSLPDEFSFPFKVNTPIQKLNWIDNVLDRFIIDDKKLSIRKKYVLCQEKFKESIAKLLHVEKPIAENNKLLYALIRLIKKTKPINHRILIYKIIISEKLKDLYQFEKINNLHCLLIMNYSWISNSKYDLRTYLVKKIKQFEQESYFYYAALKYLSNSGIYSIKDCFSYITLCAPVINKEIANEIVIALREITSEEDDDLTQLTNWWYNQYLLNEYKESSTLYKCLKKSLCEWNEYEERKDLISRDPKEVNPQTYLKYLLYLDKYKETDLYEIQISIENYIQKNISIPPEIDNKVSSNYWENIFVRAIEIDKDIANSYLEIERSDIFNLKDIKKVIKLLGKRKKQEVLNIDIPLRPIDDKMKELIIMKVSNKSDTKWLENLKDLNQK